MAEQDSQRAGDYELVPHDELEHLQREVERIKKNPFGDQGSSRDLLTAIDQLNRNVAKLVRIFETASDEIVRDYKDHAATEKINRVLDQNEKLAQGLVAIADLLKEQKAANATFETPVEGPTIEPPSNAGVPTFEPGPVDAPPPVQGAPPQGQNPPGPKPSLDIDDVPPPPPR